MLDAGITKSIISSKPVTHARLHIPSSGGHCKRDAGMFCIILPIVVLSTVPCTGLNLIQRDQYDIPAPSTPELTFINISSVNISWDFDHSAISAAQNVCFVVEYQNNTRYANVSSKIYGESNTFYIFTWLLKGERYRFRIYATSGVMTTVGGWTFMFINGIEAPPGPPQKFGAQAISDTEIILAWDNLVMLSVAYEICYDVAPTCVEGPTILVAGGNDHLLSGLKPATTYYFEIRALVGPFYSIWSNWINATTRRTSIPAPSTPELTFINISSVNISWNFHYSAISAAQNVCFVIEYQNNTRYANVSSMICGESHTFYIFPWLVRGQQYRFRIYATSGVMTTVGGWTFMFINGIEAPPGPPKNFRAKALSDTEIHLAWDDFFLLSDNSVAYDICYDVTPTCVEGPTILVTGGNYHDVAPLLPSTTYYFKIRAFLGPFNSVWSHWIGATTYSSIPLDIPVPCTPKLTFISISSVNISWEFDYSAISAAQNVCFVIEYQNGSRYANVSSMICQKNHNFYTFPWLMKGQQYRFRVYATDGVMTTVGDWTFRFINGVETPPGPPWNFRAQAISDTEIQLSWDRLSMLSNIPVAYEICYDVTPSCDEGPTILVTNTTYHVLLGLKPATTYYIEIKASLGPFNSIWSNWINAATGKSGDVIDPTSTVIITTARSDATSCSIHEPNVTRCSGGNATTTRLAPTGNPAQNSNNKDGATMTSTPSIAATLSMIMIINCIF